MLLSPTLPAELLLRYRSPYPYPLFIHTFSFSFVEIFHLHRSSSLLPHCYRYRCFYSVRYRHSSIHLFVLCFLFVSLSLLPILYRYHLPLPSTVTIVYTVIINRYHIPSPSTSTLYRYHLLLQSSVTIYRRHLRLLLYAPLQTTAIIHRYCPPLTSTATTYRYNMPFLHNVTMYRYYIALQFTVSIYGRSLPSPLPDCPRYPIFHVTDTFRALLAPHRHHRRRIGNTAHRVATETKKRPGSRGYRGGQRLSKKSSFPPGAAARAWCRQALTPSGSTLPRSKVSSFLRFDARRREKRGGAKLPLERGKHQCT